MDKDTGWHFAHRVGDLIKVVKRDTINLEQGDIGDIGIVLTCPNQTDGVLFVEAYMFKTGKVRWYSPREIDIISNIDE
jgi:hypothetical protein